MLSALRALFDGEVAAEQAQACALDALQRYRDQAALAARLPSIERELTDARRQEPRQAKARARAKALGVVQTEEPAPEVVSRILGEVDEERRGHEEAERSAKTETEATERRLKELDARRRELSAREPEWRKHSARASRLSVHLGTTVDSRASLDAARTSLGVQFTTVSRAEEDLRIAQEQLLRQARELLASGGPFPPDLLKLKDQIGAELVAETFEDVGPEELCRLHCYPESALSGAVIVLGSPRRRLPASQGTSHNTRPPRLPTTAAAQGGSMLDDNKVRTSSSARIRAGSLQPYVDAFAERSAGAAGSDAGSSFGEISAS